MGRTRKPLSEQQGNLTKEQQIKRQAEQELVKTDNKYFQKPPDWLTNDLAKAEYKRIVKAMKNMDMLGDLDTNNLACYCNAFASYLQVTAQIDRFITDGDVNPLITVQMKYAKEMRDFARLCGLSIDSRLKFATVKLDEVSENITNEFGDV